MKLLYFGKSKPRWKNWKKKNTSENLTITNSLCHSAQTSTMCQCLQSGSYLIDILQVSIQPNCSKRLQLLKLHISLRKMIEKTPKMCFMKRTWSQKHFGLRKGKSCSCCAVVLYLSTFIQVHLLVLVLKISVLEYYKNSGTYILSYHFLYICIQILKKGKSLKCSDFSLLSKYYNFSGQVLQFFLCRARNKDEFCLVSNKKKHLKPLQMKPCK